MRSIAPGVNVSQEFVEMWNNIQPLPVSLEQCGLHLRELVAEFSDKNQALLDKRANFQQQIDQYFQAPKGRDAAVSDVVKYLKSIGYIVDPKSKSVKVRAENLEPEITDIQGPQLVVPADKANMVLNAVNGRYGCLEKVVAASNMVTSADEEGKIREAKQQRDSFLNAVVPLAHSAKWEDVAHLSFDKNSKQLHFYTHAGEETRLQNSEQLVGVNFLENGLVLSDCIFVHNRLHIELKLNVGQVPKDLWLESTLTCIIDLEDASLSAPENKISAYRNIKKIIDGSLTCEVRGELRGTIKNTSYLDAKTLQVKTLKRKAFPLVREVGAHLFADSSLINIDGNPILEKILDCYLTSLFGMRYHVVPKSHGAEEVALTVELFAKINRLLGLPINANKLGVMNEEIRTNAQLYNSIAEAQEVLFFTNSGFLDYTGSFIDLMMHKGPIDSYRSLVNKIYKSSYEENNVYVSLLMEVPQIGAGMWAKIRDMKGLLENKKNQVKALNDTGWSPSPQAATIHVMAYHLAGDVVKLQEIFLQAPKQIEWEPMFTFPKADLAALSASDIEENVAYALHGLLAYAEPWVRRGVGCSGVKELSGEPLMEDRATARIKTAFVRNWLLHHVVSAGQVERLIEEMARLVDSQNADKSGYVPIVTPEMNDPVIQAVRQLVFNPQAYRNSYVEPYLYAAYLRAHSDRKTAGAAVDFMGDWDVAAVVNRAV